MIRSRCEDLPEDWAIGYAHGNARDAAAELGPLVGRARLIQAAAMIRGELVSIFVCPAPKQRMLTVPEARAVAGRGLEGDRYHDGTGTYYKPDPDCQITLIEQEALDALARDYELWLPAEDSRRNLLTRGVPLNHLADKRFRIGDVELRGHRLCEPCKHLEQVSGQNVRAGLVHRGGLRAEVIRGGVIRAGDVIELV